jgi:hypothetical protein
VSTDSMHALTPLCSWLCQTPSFFSQSVVVCLDCRLEANYVRACDVLLPATKKTRFIRAELLTGGCDFNRAINKG